MSYKLKGNIKFNDAIEYSSDRSSISQLVNFRSNREDFVEMTIHKYYSEENQKNYIQIEYVKLIKDESGEGNSPDGVPDFIYQDLVVYNSSRETPWLDDSYKTALFSNYDINKTQPEDYVLVEDDFAQFLYKNKFDGSLDLIRQEIKINAKIKHKFVSTSDQSDNSKINAINNSKLDAGELIFFEANSNYDFLRWKIGNYLITDGDSRNYVNNIPFQPYLRSGKLEGSAILGMHPKNIDGKLFAIGNGSLSNESTAFYVDEDGNGVFKGSITASNFTPESYCEKDYVDNNFAKSPAWILTTRKMRLMQHLLKLMI